MGLYCVLYDSRQAAFSTRSVLFPPATSLSGWFTIMFARHLAMSKWVLLALVLALSGCDRRGPNEREYDRQRSEVRRLVADPDSLQRTFFEQLEKADREEARKKDRRLLETQRRVRQGEFLAQQPDTASDTSSEDAASRGVLRLGLTVERLRPSSAANLGLTDRTALFVNAVSPAARRAGLVRGDILGAVNGETLSAYVLDNGFEITRDLTNSASWGPEGRLIACTVLRSGGWVTIAVPLMSVSQEDADMRWNL